MMNEGNTMFTYDDNTFSDLHKDAYGFRPRGHRFYDATPAEKQEIWDYTIRALEASIEEEKEREARALEEFEHCLAETIRYGAADRETALRWMTQGKTFHHSQDVEGWVYDQGILFTDYGRKLVKELEKIVEFSFDWE